MKIRFLLDEKWKIIKDFPDYKISNYGRIKRVIDSPKSKSGKILKACNSKTNKYLRVVLIKNGNRKTKYVACLVAEAFLGLRLDGKEVNHRDGNKTNPYVNNLEYVTKSENTKHAYRLGLINQNGERNPRAKLTEKNVKKIRKLYEMDKYTQQNLADKFNISQLVIWSIIHRKTWKHI